MEMPSAKVELEELRGLLPRVILASGSPNRLELLRNAGIEVTVRPQDIAEDKPSGQPGPMVLSIASKKLEHYIKSDDFEPNLPALCLDTLVYFEGRFLGKPASETQALEEIKSFSGKEQEVFSGYAMYHPLKGIIRGFDRSTVTFCSLSDGQVSAYIATGEWRGAAGGYRIQKTGYKLIDHICGSWTNVIGLPVEALVRELKSTV
jgi:septum formation protein